MKCLILSLIIFFLSILSQSLSAKFYTSLDYQVEQGEFSQSGVTKKFNQNSLILKAGYLGEYFIIGLKLKRGDTLYGEKLLNTNESYYLNAGPGSFLGFYFWDRVLITTEYLNTKIEPRYHPQFAYYGQEARLALAYRFYKGFTFTYSRAINIMTQEEDYVTKESKSIENTIKHDSYAFSLGIIALF